MNVLFVADELYPIRKRGGLGDVCYGLALALQEAGHDVRVMIPGFEGFEDKLLAPEVVTEIHSPPLDQKLIIYKGCLPECGLQVYGLKVPALYGSLDGAAYQPGASFEEASLYYGLAAAAVDVAANGSDAGWHADVVHCHDWHTGLVPVLLQEAGPVVPCLFTIHNLAYQGLFERDVFERLCLPERLWHIDGLEYYDKMSFMKAGLNFADRITTVSEHYACEIQTAEFGCGLEGLLSKRRHELCGIVNGLDKNVWSPKNDELIYSRFDASKLAARARNKLRLQGVAGLTADKGIFLLGLVSRLVEQKGLELLADAIPRLMAQKLQLIILGTGDAEIEDNLRQLAEKYPQQLAVLLKFDEGLAHQLIAGSDALLVPSRYEPCGLTQLYAMAYGSLPIARATGGLADTIHAGALGDSKNTGFLFAEYSADALFRCVVSAQEVYHLQPFVWRSMQRRAMQQDFGWARSAEKYFALYTDIIASGIPRAANSH